VSDKWEILAFTLQPSKESQTDQVSCQGRIRREGEIAGKSYFLLLSPCALTPGSYKRTQTEAWPEKSRFLVKITNEDFN